jgi:uncharacterized protein DUF6886
MLHRGASYNHLFPHMVFGEYDDDLLGCPSAVVTPASVVDQIEDAIGALLARVVELRIVPELHSLRDDVVASTLQFSISAWEMRSAHTGLRRP